MNKKKGFTMVELIAVMAISTILGGLVLSLFISLNNLYTRSQAETTFNNNSRIIFSTVENDIRVAKNIVTPASTAVTTIEINSVRYSLPTSCRVLAGYTKKVSSSDLAYAIVIMNNKIYRLKQSGTNRLVEENLGYGNIDTTTSFVKSSDGKKYTFDLKFIDAKRNRASYQTVITPRN